MDRDGGLMRRPTMKLLQCIGTVLCLFLLPAVVFSQTTSSPQGLTWGEYRISEPKTYKNLTVFLVQGKDTLSASTPLTLEEALKQKIVIVHETGDVNDLA